MVVPGVMLNIVSVDMSKEFSDDWKWKVLPQFVLICDKDRIVDTLGTIIRFENTPHSVAGALTSKELSFPCL